jgi:hypothetical protein
MKKKTPPCPMGLTKGTYRALSNGQDEFSKS